MYFNDFDMLPYYMLMSQTILHLPFSLGISKCSMASFAIALTLFHMGSILIS